MDPVLSGYGAMGVINAYKGTPVNSTCMLHDLEQMLCAPLS